MIQNDIFPLNSLSIGEKGEVFSLSFSGLDRRRLLDLGFTRGTIVEAVQKSAFGDPVAYFLRGTTIALRCADAEKISVRPAV